MIKNLIVPIIKVSGIILISIISMPISCIVMLIYIHRAEKHFKIKTGTEFNPFDGLSDLLPKFMKGGKRLPETDIHHGWLWYVFFGSNNGWF